MRTLILFAIGFVLGELFEKYRVQIIEFAKKVFKKNEVSNEPKS